MELLLLAMIIVTVLTISIVYISLQGVESADRPDAIREVGVPLMRLPGRHYRR